MMRLGAVILFVTITILPLAIVVYVAIRLGTPWMLATSALCVVFSFVFAYLLTALMRHTNWRDHHASIPALLHWYIPLLPLIALVLVAIAVAQRIGIRSWHDLTDTNYGVAFFFACCIAGLCLYRIILHVAGRGWRELVQSQSRDPLDDSAR
jgi:hypothetical protein